MLEIDKLILKFIRKCKEPKTAELTLLKNVAEDLALPAFKAGIKQTIKAAWCSRKEHASAEESPHACATWAGGEERAGPCTAVRPFHIHTHNAAAWGVRGVKADSKWDMGLNKSQL